MAQNIRPECKKQKTRGLAYIARMSFVLHDASLTGMFLLLATAKGLYT
jgi:hypothetical protein